MTKNKLIQLLQQIEGNPEIVIWNGFVEDIMPIDNKITIDYQYKETKEFITEMITHQVKKENNTEIISEQMKKEIDDSVSYRLKNDKYDFANPYITEYEHKQWYGTKKKRIAILSTKLTGKSTFDRNGKIEY